MTVLLSAVWGDRAGEVVCPGWEWEPVAGLMWHAYARDMEADCDPSVCDAVFVAFNDYLSRWFADDIPEVIEKAHGGVSLRDFFDDWVEAEWETGDGWSGGEGWRDFIAGFGLIAADVLDA